MQRLHFKITATFSRGQWFNWLSQDDVIKWKHFPRYWSFVRRIHRSPLNSPHKGQWRGALMFSLICAWRNGWVNNRDAGDLRRHRAHYDVIVLLLTLVSEVNHLRSFWRRGVQTWGQQWAIAHHEYSDDKQDHHDTEHIHRPWARVKLIFQSRVWNVSTIIINLYSLSVDQYGDVVAENEPFEGQVTQLLSVFIQRGRIHWNFPFIISVVCFFMNDVDLLILRRHNGIQFANNIVRCIFFNETLFCILIKIAV